MKIIKYSSVITADLAGFIHENQGPTRLSSIRKIRQETRTTEFENQIWIAKSQNRILGYLWIISGKKGTRGAHYQKSMYTSINELFILPSARRRKIGSQLLQNAQAYALEQAGPIIHADVTNENWIAQQFFHHHQYEIIQQWKWQGKSMLRFKKIHR